MSAETPPGWLQWATYDLAGGVGGVEVHARSVARELRKLGVDAELSSNPASLEDPRWTVVHTHGSSLPPARWIRARLSRSSRPRPLWIHTLHGTTLGRMAACREWAWPGGYAAAAREVAAVASADVILAVHSRLHLYALAGRLGKARSVCGNGWDAGETEEPLPSGLDEISRAPFWLYVGRGADPVKGADRVRRVLARDRRFRLIAAPGDGFESLDSVVRAGPLAPGQIRRLMSRSQGILLLSRYEGLPLVVLEALSLGLPVVATQVGGLSMLPSGVEGFFPVSNADSEAVLASVLASMREASGTFPGTRESRSRRNRDLLPSWRQVAQAALAAFSQAISREAR